MFQPKSVSDGKKRKERNTQNSYNTPYTDVNCHDAQKLRFLVLLTLAICSVFQFHRICGYLPLFSSDSKDTCFSEVKLLLSPKHISKTLVFCIWKTSQVELLNCFDCVESQKLKQTCWLGRKEEILVLLMKAHHKTKLCSVDTELWLTVAKQHFDKWPWLMGSLSSLGGFCNPYIK